MDSRGYLIPVKNEMENVYVIDQFTNPANPDTHFRWTGNVSSSM